MNIKTVDQVLAEVDAKLRKQLDTDVQTFVLGYWQAMMQTTKQYESYTSFLAYVKRWTNERTELTLSDVSHIIGDLYQGWRKSL
jgi:hypothetical protein